MIDEPGFLAQLYAQPDDDTTRLIYADWLEDQGDPRGLYLRREVELAELTGWCLDYEAREQELRQLRTGLPDDWLELAAKRYDVWLVEPPTETGMLHSLLLTLVNLGHDPLEAVALLGHLPEVVLENALRPAAEDARDRLLRACHGQVPPTGTDLPVRLRPARTPQPRLCRFPAPADTPGHALRLLGGSRRRKADVVSAIHRVCGGTEEDARAIIEGELPWTLRTYATPEEARRAACLFKGLASVEVRHVEAPPRGRMLDRPLIGRFSVLVHRFPDRVRGQLVSVIRLMTGCSLAEARQRVNQPPPLLIQGGLEWERAEALRLALPALATVEVIEERLV